MEYLEIAAGILAPFAEKYLSGLAYTAGAIAAYKILM